MQHQVFNAFTVKNIFVKIYLLTTANTVISMQSIKHIRQFKRITLEIMPFIKNKYVELLSDTSALLTNASSVVQVNYVFANE